MASEKLAVWVVVSFIVALVLSSCLSSPKSTLSHMLGKRVAFPEEMIRLSHGKLTRADSLKPDPNRRVVLFYFDEWMCSSCVILKLSRLREDASERLGMEPFFLMAVPEDLSDAVAETKIDTSLVVYLDADGTFAKRNRFIPKDSRFHVMLLDGDRTILAVGNPFSNARMMKLYKHLGREDSGRE